MTHGKLEIRAGMQCVTIDVGCKQIHLPPEDARRLAGEIDRAATTVQVRINAAVPESFMGSTSTNRATVRDDSARRCKHCGREIDSGNWCGPCADPLADWP